MVIHKGSSGSVELLNDGSRALEVHEGDGRLALFPRWKILSVDFESGAVEVRYENKRGRMKKERLKV